MERRPIDFVAILTEALRYWEKQRLTFNIVCGIVLLVSNKWGLLIQAPLSFLMVVGIWFILLTLLNILYCVCYIPEIIFQISDLRDQWTRRRPLVFAHLTVLGGILAWLIPKMWGI